MDTGSDFPAVNTLQPVGLESERRPAKRSRTTSEDDPVETPIWREYWSERPTQTQSYEQFCQSRFL